jgi:hypothetical protein
MTRNFAFGVEITLLMRIFAVVRPAVRVDLSPGYSIWSPPTVSLVLYFSSWWSLMSTTKEQYVTFRPFGMPDLRMNRIVFVLYSLLISFAVDFIHFVLWLNFVMSSWCLRDLTVSGQITAFAISGEIIMTVLLFVGWVYLVFAEIENQWFTCERVSAIMSWDKFCCLALRRTMPWGVCGVTTCMRGVCCLRCEFGVDCDVITFYTMIAPTELTQNYERLNTPYDPNQPIETLFQQIQDARAFAVAGGQP